MEASKVRKGRRSGLPIGAAAAALAALVGCESIPSDVLDQTGGAIVANTVNPLRSSSWGRVFAPGAEFAMSRAIQQLLSETEQREVEQQSAEALSGARDGQPVEWRSRESGSTATITPSRTRRERREVVVVREERVSAPANLELMGDMYRATRSANLRAGPSTETERVGSLSAGEEFRAVGKTAGSWILVGQRGRSVGYVYASLVSPAPRSSQSSGLREPVNLDDVELEDGVVADEVVATTSCRSMKVVVTKEDGRTATDSMDACRAPDGAWEI